METIHRRYVSIVKRLKIKCPILGQQTFFLKLQSWHFSVQTHLNIPCTTTYVLLWIQTAKNSIFLQPKNNQRISLFHLICFINTLICLDSRTKFILRTITFLYFRNISMLFDKNLSSELGILLPFPNVCANNDGWKFILTCKKSKLQKQVIH